MPRFSRLVLSALVLVASGSAAPAALITYVANLDGPSESPPNASPGTGTATIIYDTDAHTLDMDVTFSGLVGTTTNAHIHATTADPFTGTAGVATTTPTFAGFPSGVMSGSYMAVLDLTLASSYSAAFLSANGNSTAAAETALMTAIADGHAYWNIHSSMFSGGEIRGFFNLVPEPATLSLVAVAGLVLRRRRRR